MAMNHSNKETEMELTVFMQILGHQTEYKVMNHGPAKISQIASNSEQTEECLLQQEGTGSRPITQVKFCWKA